LHKDRDCVHRVLDRSCQAYALSSRLTGLMIDGFHTQDLFKIKSIACHSQSRQSARCPKNHSGCLSISHREYTYATFCLSTILPTSPTRKTGISLPTISIKAGPAFSERVHPHDAHSLPRVRLTSTPVHHPSVRVACHAYHRFRACLPVVLLLQISWVPYGLFVRLRKTANPAA
jgi:hypothetical protein